MERYHLIAAAFALASAPALALGQGTPAEVLFDEGRRALNAGDYGVACARLRESDDLDPAAGTRANLGLCEEQRGHLVAALAAWRGALAKVNAGDPREAPFRQRVVKLEARVPKLVVSLADGADPATVVHEGEAKIVAAGGYDVPLLMDPGAHRIFVTAPGRAPRRLDVVLVEGETTPIVVSAGPEVVVAPVDLHPGPKPAPEAPRPAVVRGPGAGPWILGGAGLAALSVGAVLGGLVVYDRSVVEANCTLGSSPGCRNMTGVNAAQGVHSLGPATTVALVAGGTLLAGSGVWFGLRLRGERGDAGRSTVADRVHLRVGPTSFSTQVSW